MFPLGNIDKTAVDFINSWLQCYFNIKGYYNKNGRFGIVF